VVARILILNPYCLTVSVVGTDFVAVSIAEVCLLKPPILLSLAAVFCLCGNSVKASTTNVKQVPMFVSEVVEQIINNISTCYFGNFINFLRY
jgi:hypothetical protein